jgi:hypothetical protein
VLADLQNQVRALRDVEKAISLPSMLRGRATNLSRFDVQIAAGTAVRATFLRLTAHEKDVSALRATLTSRLVQNRDLLEAGGPIAAAASDFNESFAAFRQADEEFRAHAVAEAMPTLNEIETLVAATLERSARLKDWCAWVEAERMATAQGLGALAVSVAGGLTAPESAGGAFETAYCR